MGQELVKIVLKNAIVTLVTFFAIFISLGKNIFSNMKHIFYFSQTTSKPLFTATRLTMVTVARRFQNEKEDGD
jgi:hypothetical protein